MAAPDPKLVVEAVGLTKIFRDFWGRPKARAVDDISFEIKSGEVFGFLGPNGSGKSTTIKMLLGLLYPSSGSLKVFGRAPDNVQAKLRIGYLPEETYLYRYLTAAETLDFFGALFNLAPAERRNRTRQLLDMVGLSHAANRPVGEFSKGMARRIGLAQALVNDPDLIILDEPTSGLDPIGCRQVKEIIRLLASRQKTVILCSHLLADVQDVCDNVLIMYGGKVRARGSLGELLTVEDKTRIIAPTLAPDVLEHVMQVLNEAVATDAYRIDHPSLSLEDYFMEVVRKAREDSETTAGAATEGAIADYLSGGGKKAGEALLEALAEKEPPPEEPETAEAAKPQPELDADRLARLADAQEEDRAPVETEPPPDPSAPAEPMSDDERAAASKKIEDLLKGK